MDWYNIQIMNKEGEWSAWSRNAQGFKVLAPPGMFRSIEETERDAIKLALHLVQIHDYEARGMKIVRVEGGEVTD